MSLYTNEDVDPRLAVQLTALEYDVLSCHAAGNHNQPLTDEWQLLFACSQERAILVANVKDYATRDRRWRSQHRQHDGIVLISSRATVGDLVRRVSHHVDTYSRDAHFNLVLYLAP